MIEPAVATDLLTVASRFDTTAYHFKAAQLWMQGEYAPGIAKFLYKEMQERWGYASMIRERVHRHGGVVHALPAMPSPIGNRGTINVELALLLKHDIATEALISNMVKKLMPICPMSGIYLAGIGENFAKDVCEVRAKEDHTRENMKNNIHLLVADKYE